MQQQNILTHYCNNISKSCKRETNKAIRTIAVHNGVKSFLKEISYFDAPALTIGSYVLVKHLPMRTSND